MRGANKIITLKIKRVTLRLRLRTMARGEWKKFRSSLPELNKCNFIAPKTIASSGTRNFFYEQKREKDGDRVSGSLPAGRQGPVYEETV